MPTLLIYLLLAAVLVYLISKRDRFGQGGAPADARDKSLGRPSTPGGIWKQVYETASLEEAALIRTELTAAGIGCVVYEQGKKDIHGNPLAGIGVAVPGDSAAKAQSIIVKMPA
ncbi:MAG: DUF2007 domain-containing protein [Candidatus Omnitrophica bacterium]|nr:DUF2007 domain-containing protein [Candidatus Omnitrophota bacterium]